MEKGLKKVCCGVDDPFTSPLFKSFAINSFFIKSLKINITPHKVDFEKCLKWLVLSKEKN